MKIQSLHRWNVDLGKAKLLQHELCGKIELKRLDDPVRLIAGADVSYSYGTSSVYAAVVVMSYPEMAELELVTAAGRVTFPYVSGYLSFREAPILLEAFANIKISPDVVLFDGQGIAHPRGMGIASHMGLFLDVPTIGCAKTRLIGMHDTVPENRGAHVMLKHNGSGIGAVLRTRTAVKPIFVSAGHKITLEEALEVTMKAPTRFRLPEPIRTAHRLSNQLRMLVNRIDLLND